MQKAHRIILEQLAPYELGEGWPNPEKPAERNQCDKLVKTGMLERNGTAYRLTPQGREIGEHSTRPPLRAIPV